jgi:cytochrome c biogenesis protein CcdA/thiol-disulfide isomerase/thioredoxin
MVLLLAFALVAGLATSLSPCALPVLPVALAAGATGGRRRPLGVVTGLVLSFTFATIALVYVIAALGLPDDLLRDVAIVVLVAFGISLLVPALSARIEAWLTRLGRAPRDADRSGGFVSGLPLGFSLGLLYAPCAGPILAGVITVSAAQTFTAGRLAVAFAYAVGSAAGLYAVMLGGRRLVGRLVSRSARVQQAMGAVMIVVAVLIAAMVDVRLQTAIANDLPSFLLSPADKLQSGAGHHSRFTSAKNAKSSGLPVLGQAPDFRDNQRWFNTPAGAPLTMTGLRGRVVLVDFWTYTCINCIRTLPHLKALDAKYRRDGLTIVGVHSPEFPFERDASNVKSSIKQNGLRYPVVQDNKLGTWNAWGNQYWPADYLVDSRGRVRFTQFGEGGYAKTERAVRALLREAGHDRLGGDTRARVETASAGLQTPETYLGAARADGFVNGQIAAGAQEFGRRLPPLSANSFGYAGQWKVGEDSATAGAGARVGVDFVARRVFLVLGSPDRPRKLRVLLDGKPIPGRLAGADVHAGAVTVRAQRLYRLVNLSRAEEHKLTLAPEPGISGYAFTFG